MRRVALGASLAGALLGAPHAYALGQKRFVGYDQPPATAFGLVRGSDAAPLYTDSSDFPAVLRAVADLQTDIDRVSARRPALAKGTPSGADVVIIGTLGKNSVIDRLARSGALDVAGIKGKWEAWHAQVLVRPLPGVERALVIAGSDRRGTIYGVYELSEQIGVSPWHWWADVQPQRHRQLYVEEGTNVSEAPVVKYRGMALDGEAPGLAAWAKQSFGGYNAKFYERVYELLLRMRGNTLWPATSEAAFLSDDRQNAQRAEDYGVMLGTPPSDSKAKRLWKGPQVAAMCGGEGKAPPDDALMLMCDDGAGYVRRLPAHDERKRAGGAGIEYHIARDGAHRSWLNAAPLSKVWEQLHLAWRHGADRMWIAHVGSLKPFEVPAEFFFTYAWNPEAWPAERLPDYLKLWAGREFGPQYVDDVADIVGKTAQYNARRPPELLAVGDYSVLNGEEAAKVVGEYRAISGKAEKIDGNLPSDLRDSFYQLVLYPAQASAVVVDMLTAAAQNRMQAEQGRVAANDLASKVRDLFKQDGELARVYHEDISSGKWNRLMSQVHLGGALRNVMPAVAEVQPSRVADMGVAVEGSAAVWPETGGGTLALPKMDAGGKQQRYVDIFNRGQNPFKFTIAASAPWISLSRSSGTVAKSQRITVDVRWAEVPPNAEMAGLAILGPDGAKAAVRVPLRPMAAGGKPASGSYVESQGAVAVEAEHFARALAPEGRQWLRIPGLGRTLSGMTALPVVAPPPPPPPPAPPPKPEAVPAEEEKPATDEQQAKPATDDEAPATFSAAPAPDPVPVTPPAPPPPKLADLRLEYDVHLATAGKVAVQAVLSPTRAFMPGQGLRYAVAIDDEAPHIVDLHDASQSAAWATAAQDNAVVLSTVHTVARPGAHVLKFWSIDPGVVLQRLVVDTGSLKPTLLGPPESPKAP
ncbi:glycosyl hydrolase 115 family protein [Pseudoduganella ginsengisoli]|nr:glycosyl hydrolase 115 family protein [Pseudoduganella ginsengisoli]